MGISQTISGWMDSARKTGVKNAVLRPHDAAVAGAILIAAEAAGLPIDLQAALATAQSPVNRLQDIPLRIEHARKVADLCTAARMRHAAPGYVSRHVDIDLARAALINARADDGIEINSSQPPLGGRTSVQSDSEDVYKRRANNVAAVTRPAGSNELEHSA